MTVMWTDRFIARLHEAGHVLGAHVAGSTPALIEVHGTGGSVFGGDSAGPEADVYMALSGLTAELVQGFPTSGKDSAYDFTRARKWAERAWGPSWRAELDRVITEVVVGQQQHRHVVRRLANAIERSGDRMTGKAARAFLEAQGVRFGSRRAPITTTTSHADSGVCVGACSRSRSARVTDRRALGPELRAELAAMALFGGVGPGRRSRRPQFETR